MLNLPCYITVLTCPCLRYRITLRQKPYLTGQPQNQELLSLILTRPVKGSVLSKKAKN
jgi:hypothetical protein